MGEALWGIFLSNTWPTPTLRPLPSLPLLICFLHKLWGEQDCQCYCKQPSNICSCWKPLAMIKFLLLSFSHCLQWTKVHNHSCAACKFLDFFCGCWLVLHLWNTQRIDKSSSGHFLAIVGALGAVGTLVAITPASGTCLPHWGLKCFHLSRSLQLIWGMWMKFNARLEEMRLYEHAVTCGTEHFMLALGGYWCFLECCVVDKPDT